LKLEKVIFEPIKAENVLTLKLCFSSGKEMASSQRVTTFNVKTEIRPRFHFSIHDLKAFNYPFPSYLSSLETLERKQ
jgi:hypothetical protein